MWTWRTFAVTVLKTYATFWFICVLWSLWTAESMPDWLSLWSALKGRYTVEVLLFPVLVLVVIALGSIPNRKAETANPGAGRQPRQNSGSRSHDRDRWSR